MTEKLAYLLLFVAFMLIFPFFASIIPAVELPAPAVVQPVSQRMNDIIQLLGAIGILITILVTAWNTVQVQLHKNKIKKVVSKIEDHIETDAKASISAVDKK